MSFPADLFLIDRTTGVLRNQKDLTGYSKLLPYVLEVVARDNGVPYLTQSVMVNVFISDLRGNDDIPHIISPSKDGQVFKVPEVRMVLIRWFENELFYDPYLTFFHNDYLYIDSPRREVLKLVAFTVLRYVLNGLVSLGILYVVFKDRNINVF